MASLLKKLGLRTVINAAGFVTPLGSSSVRPEVVAAISEILPEYAEMSMLQAKASEVIARVTGAEAGCVTGCAAAGVSSAIAACMTGEDLVKIEQLPNSDGLRNEVVLQKGHEVDAGGAPIETLIRLTGARAVLAGRANQTGVAHLEGAITDKTAAILHVYAPDLSPGLLPLEVTIEVARRHGIPVIVDVAAEYDLRGFIAAGADIVVYSAHKFLSGATAGMVAGKSELIRACYLQERGIGRVMKVGKEGIVGLVAALEAHERDNHADVRQQEQAVIDYWMERLQGLPGIRCVAVPDSCGNPVTRVNLFVDPEVASINAFHLARKLKEGEPSIRVRDRFAHTGGYIELESCPLKDKEAESKFVCDRIISILTEARNRKDPTLVRVGASDWKVGTLSNWPSRK